MIVSVSNLDLYRRYRLDEEFELDELLAMLRREQGPTLAMRAGTAFHSVLEHTDMSTLDVSGADEFVFTFELDDEISLPPVREMRGQRDYYIGGHVVTLKGRVDGLDGVAIYDHKLTAHFDASNYVDSYQWRCYLAIFGARQFTYNVFVGSRAKESPEGLIAWRVTDFHKLSLFTYPELERDVERELARYVDFAQRYLILEAA